MTFRPNICVASACRPKSSAVRAIFNAAGKQCDVLTRSEDVAKPVLDHITWNDADAGIIDVSKQSNAVGTALMYAVAQLRRPCLVVYEEGATPPISDGLLDTMLPVRSYSSKAELEALVSGFCATLVASQRCHKNFVRVDAIDGAGKGVWSEALKQWAVRNSMPLFDLVQYHQHANYMPTWEEIKTLVPGCKMLLIAEPTYTGVGKIVRDTLIKTGSPYHPSTTASGYSIDRDVMLERVTVPALNDGVLVFSDRGPETSDFYQSVQAEHFRRFDREFFRGHVRGLQGNQNVFAHAPQLLILMDVPPEVAHGRSQNRDKQDNAVFEQLDFQEKVHESYRDPRLRRYYERRGTTVEDFVVPRTETRDETRVRAYNRFEQFYHEFHVEPVLYGIEMPPYRRSIIGRVA